VEIYLASIVVIGVALTGMAVGVILSNKSLKGSCGGLGSVMGEDCMFCENKDKCKRKKEDADMPTTPASL
jgi:hypothetical protein